ncbi:MAG: dihydrofolate reductase family protein [Saprospiraceae bacterium]|nr:dihydrofolate reductase family protein [Saprospiraceae bacterium]
MKVICYIAVSMDGYIARDDGAVDWLNRYMDVDYGYQAFSASIDAVIMGHATYLKSLEFGPEAFQGEMPYFVMTRNPDRQDAGKVQFVTDPPQQLCAKLRGRGDLHRVWMMGGGQVLQAFLDEGLVDEMMLFVIPEMLGTGIPLFPSGTRPAAWQLHRNEAYMNGVVLLHYHRANFT